MEPTQTLIEWMKQIRSEVEINRVTVRTGDVLHYIDQFNCQKWEVITVSENGFVAISEQESQGEPMDFYFAHLQKGWTISQKSKDFNVANYRTKYV